MRGKVNFKYLMFVLTMYLLIFQNLLMNYIKPIQYFDEFLALMAFPLILHKKKKDLKINKANLKIIVSLLLLLLIGIYSNIKYKLQPFSIVIGDILIVFKFFLVYFLTTVYWNGKQMDKYKSDIIKHTRMIIYMLFSLSVFNYVFKLWPYEYRFGIMNNRLFYSHPTMLCGICIFLCSLLFQFSEKIYKREIILLILIIISTFRFKAIGAAIAILIIIFFVYKNKSKISVTKIGLIGLIIFVAAWDQINYYYIDLDKSARNQLTMKSIEIAKDYFPVGTGFGTFGSHMSSVNYSPVYQKYGLSHIFGLQKDNHLFISDTFWPMIIGQFGVVGGLCYIYCLIIIFKKIQKTYVAEKNGDYIAKLICFIYLIISSTSETAFVHPLAIPLAIILGYSRNNKKKNEVCL